MIIVEKQADGQVLSVRTADWGADALRVVERIDNESGSVSATFVFQGGYWQRRP